MKLCRDHEKSVVGLKEEAIVPHINTILVLFSPCRHRFSVGESCFRDIKRSNMLTEECSGCSPAAQKEYSAVLHSLGDSVTARERFRERKERENHCMLRGGV